MLDLDRAIASPMDVFTHPDQVVREPAMTRDQRILALRQWRHDLRELQVATDENMGDEDVAGEDFEALDAALLQLGADPDSGSPTRSGA